MSPGIFGNPFATRRMLLDGSGNVTLVIGAPFPVDELKEEYWCPYQISGLGDEKIRRGIGIDSLQALCMALYGASNDLYLSEEYKAGKLSWEGGMTIADLGLPASEGMSEGVQDAKSRVEALKQHEQDSSCGRRSRPLLDGQ